MFSSDISQSLVEKQINESFITKYEYGKMLYNNPRGISCAKCHGNDGKGILLSTFKHTTKDLVYTCKVKTDDITNISFEKFSAKLELDMMLMDKLKFEKHQVCEKLIYGNTMPKYFLTKNEQETIYYYITHINKK
ncbi:MAG: hypothetical protein HY307_03215 [Arcobacter sp.]|nr:hypothetical protein [Arcobacter sp.]